MSQLNKILPILLFLISLNNCIKNFTKYELGEKKFFSFQKPQLGIYLHLTLDEIDPESDLIFFVKKNINPIFKG